MNMFFSKICFLFFLNCVATSVYSQHTSPHTIQFVTVEKNVQLEVLDWGGKGKPIILLAGGGNTAHIFDDFAPKLAANFHVYGITRRGFGASQYSPIDNADRIGKDILAVIDSLKIIKPILAAHSIGGAELSTVARISPAHISGLIYLDAGYPYAFSTAESPTMQSYMEISGPPHPTPGEKDLVNFKALQKWDAEMYGLEKPESEFRQTWDSTSDGRPTQRRNSPGFASFSTILNDSVKHSNISVPSLVIFAIPHMQEPWVIKSSDQKVRTDGQIHLAKIDSLTIKQAKAFKDGVPAAQVIQFKGMHYIFMSNESEILRAMKKFISRLK